MENIVIVCRGKVIRMSTENRALIEALVLSSPVSTKVVGERDGRKYTFQLVSGRGFRWVEVTA